MVGPRRARRACGGNDRQRRWDTTQERSCPFNRLGAGRFVLNTPRILERLGQDPTAARLLRNLIRYGAADAAKPPADLTPQFDEHLKANGY